MRQIVLLRGINLGARNRVSMPELRELLTGAGFQDVATYLQSGNVVVSSELGSEELAQTCRRLLADALGLDIAVVTRTRDELVQVVANDPLAGVVTDPRRYQVTFLSAELSADRLKQLAELATPQERLLASGRELYAWHPDGAARSKLWNRLAGQDLGVTATARNWTTVTNLLALADR
jgi:uncharacterized protein (DUF1697 family)